MKKIYNWFQRHDKFSHFLMAFGFCLLADLFIGYAIYISAGIMIAIEIYQIFRFGIKNRIKDTLLDLLADAAGIGLYFLMGIIIWGLAIMQWLGQL